MSVNYPLPPPDFDSRTLPITKYSSGKIFYRLNNIVHSSAIYFDRSGNGRYDSPNQSYGILYCAETVAGAFIETMGRTRGQLAVAIADIRQRSLFQIQTKKELQLLNLWGDSLVKLGADSSITSGINYEVARLWAERIYHHPHKVDGILYLSRHDNTQLCCGLFQRSQKYLEEEDRGNIYDSNPKLLAKILDKYNYGLI